MRVFVTVTLKPFDQALLKFFDIGIELLPRAFRNILFL